MSKETEMIDRLFLELAQFTTAETPTEQRLRERAEQAETDLQRCRSALQHITSGTDDLEHPLSGFGPDRMQEIAREALDDTESPPQTDSTDEQDDQ